MLRGLRTSMLEDDFASITMDVTLTQIQPAETNTANIKFDALGVENGIIDWGVPSSSGVSWTQSRYSSWAIATTTNNWGGSNTISTVVSLFAEKINYFPPYNTFSGEDGASLKASPFIPYTQREVDGQTRTTIAQVEKIEVLGNFTNWSGQQWRFASAKYFRAENFPDQIPQWCFTNSFQEGGSLTNPNIIFPANVKSLDVSAVFNMPFTRFLSSTPPTVESGNGFRTVIVPSGCSSAYLTYFNRRSIYFESVVEAE